MNKNSVFYDRTGKEVIKPNSVLVRDRISAYGIYIQSGKTLLIKNTWSDKFEFPGGGLENKEDIFEALKREFLEESGFEVLSFDENPVKVFNSNFYADDIDEYYFSKMYFFVVDDVKKVSEELDDEIKSFEWIDVNELSESLVKEKHLEAMKFALLKE